MASESALRDERLQLYRRIIYIYFGLFSMALAERFSINIAYGAALYLSFAALLQMVDLIQRTPHYPRPARTLQVVAVAFFVIATAYIVILYPLFNRLGNAPFAAAILTLPFIIRGVQTTLLRRFSRTKHAWLPSLIVIGASILVTGATLLFALPAGKAVMGFATSGMLVGMALDAPRFLVFHDYGENIELDAADSADVRTIQSIRLFDGMTITSGVALNIFAFTYILFLMLSRAHDVFWDFFVSFLIVVAVLVTAYFAFRRAKRSTMIGKIGKNAVFVLGTAIAIFAAYILRDNWFGSAFDISIQTSVLLLGLVLQMSGTWGLQDDMALLVKLYRKDVDADAMVRRTQLLDIWTSVLSEAIMLIVLLVLISSPLFAPFSALDYLPYAQAIGSSVAAIPTVLLLASLWFSIRQPLTEKYSRRLKALAGIRAQGSDNPAMVKRLHSVLVKKYKKRIGVHIIRALLRPVMHHTVRGKENVKDLPGIFVFNHREVYGPIAAIVFLPYDIRPWILYQMINKAEITEHISGTFSRVKWLLPVLRRWLPKVLSPIIVWALGSFDPIPVYRGAQMNVIKTFMLSIECLAAGDSVLLFPENPEHTYGKKVSDFYEGFAHLGRLYHKKTGERLTFYPVYTSSKRHELRIGEGVTYDASGGDTERGRIVETLEQRMRELENEDED